MWFQTEQLKAVNCGAKCVSFIYKNILKLFYYLYKNIYIIKSLQQLREGSSTEIIKIIFPRKCIFIPRRNVVQKGFSSSPLVWQANNSHFYSPTLSEPSYIPIQMAEVGGTCFPGLPMARALVNNPKPSEAPMRKYAGGFGGVFLPQ